MEDVLSVGQKIQVEINELMIAARLSLIPVVEETVAGRRGASVHFESSDAYSAPPSWAAPSPAGWRGVRRTVLRSGLQIVTEDIRSTSTCSLGVFVSVGSRHETPSLHGASHFLEHLLFKGTPSRTAGQISAAISG